MAPSNPRRQNRLVIQRIRRYIPHAMSIAEVSKLSLREKLQIMEVIWADLREHVDGLGMPPSHQALLGERRKRVAEGKAGVRDWDQVKGSIGGS